MQEQGNLDRYQFTVRIFFFVSLSVLDRIFSVIRQVLAI